MKRTLILLCIIYLSPVLQAQDTGGSIYAEVLGDKVVLHEDNTTRNCGFSLSVNNVVVNDNILQWFQVDTIHDYQRCYCNFNYSLEIDSLGTGDYTAYLYSVDIFDTTYLGSATFSIYTSFSHLNGLKLASYASPCLSDPGEELNVNVNRYAIEFYHSNETINKISFITMSGFTIYTEQCHSKSCEIPVCSLKDGIYVAQVFTEKGYFNKKIVIVR